MPRDGTATAVQRIRTRYAAILHRRHRARHDLPLNEPPPIGVLLLALLLAGCDHSPGVINRELIPITGDGYARYQSLRIGLECLFRSAKIPARGPEWTSPLGRALPVIERAQPCTMIFGRRYESFSVEVRAENRQGESVEGAPIGVRVRVWVRVRRLFQRNKEDSAIEGRRTHLV